MSNKSGRQSGRESEVSSLDTLDDVPSEWESEKLNSEFLNEF